MLQSPVESFSFFLFHLLTLPFSSMYMTPRAHPFVSRRLGCVMHLPHVALVASPRSAFGTRCLCCAALPPLHALPHPGGSPSPCLALSPSSHDAAAPWCVFPSFPFPFPFPFANVPFLPLCSPLRHVSPLPCIALVLLPFLCCVVLCCPGPFLHGMSPLPHLLLCTLFFLIFLFFFLFSLFGD